MKGIDGTLLRKKALGGREEARDAFKELWEYFYPRLLVYIASFKRLPASEHEDIVSDALIKAFNALETYNGMYSLSTWVYAIARNYFVDAIRKSKNMTPVSIEAIDGQNLVNYNNQKSVIDDIIDKEAVNACKRIIDTLNEKDKRLIFLKYFEELNSREIGLIEGMSPNTVRWRIAAIKSYIATHIGGRDEH
ncbi:MAG: sigma-70 family RNA polymerase sigma factor [Treponema sp.]|jgi:RNA polymerase sigma-70 factor (ECF subfamily)|nr:sigma-70 family RNA polymerase sigma factor [Treponema sp.]